MKIYIMDNFKCSFITDDVEIIITFLDENTNNSIDMQLTLNIIVTPSRFNRVLFDRYHNLIYPFDGFVLRDDLYNSNYNFDWTFESLETNYHQV